MPLCTRCGTREVPEIDDACGPCGDWAHQTFFSARIKLLAENLAPENAAKFKAMSRGRQEIVVAKMIERGVII